MLSLWRNTKQFYKKKKRKFYASQSISRKTNKNTDKNMSGDALVNYQCKYKLVEPC